MMHELLQYQISSGNTIINKRHPFYFFTNRFSNYFNYNLYTACFVVYGKHNISDLKNW